MSPAKQPARGLREMEKHFGWDQNTPCVVDHQPATSGDEDRGELGPLLLVPVCLLMALLATNKWVAAANADTVVTSLISIQRPTLFFWSQNRLAVLPAVLLSGIKDTHSNLLLLAYVQAVCFFFLTLVIAWFVTTLLFSKRNPLDLALCFGVLTAAFLVMLNAVGSYTFIVDSAQPYALSYLLLAIATGFFFFGEPRWLAVPICLLCLFWSVGVNNSILVPGLAFASLAAWCRDHFRAAVFASFCVAIFAAWYLISTFFPAPPISYYSLDFADMTHNLVLAGAAMASVVRLDGTVLFAVGATLAIILQPDRSRIVVVILWCAVFAALWSLFFAQDAWVIANRSHFRYFFPVFLCFAAAAAIAITGLLLRCSTSVKRAVIALLAVASTSYLFAWPRPVNAYPVFANVAPQAEFARAAGIHYIAGDYWLVWPIVFLLLEKPDGAFGLTVRGEPSASKVRKSITADCRSGIPVRALCVGQAPEVCIDYARRITRQDWQATDGFCPGPCSIITLARRRIGPCA